ncbi:MAG: hypothetical protein KAY24_01115 [Candidatus Eisenbacteria sp.]|nr:hypothetical protein [Candidatus Eisenbacteria bacterium]
MSTCDAHPELIGRLDRMETRAEAGVREIKAAINGLADAQRDACTHHRAEMAEDMAAMRVDVKGVWSWKEKAVAYLAGAASLAGVGYSVYRVVGA